MFRGLVALEYNNVMSADWPHYNEEAIFGEVIYIALRGLIRLTATLDDANPIERD